MLTSGLQSGQPASCRLSLPGISSSGKHPLLYWIFSPARGRNTPDFNAVLIKGNVAQDYIGLKVVWFKSSHRGIAKKVCFALQLSHAKGTKG
jgi:hypothetical protein